MKKNELLKLGRNNNLSIIKLKDNFFIKKKYASNYSTKFNRYVTELTFLKKLIIGKEKQVPMIIKYNKVEKYIVFEKINGTKIKNVTKVDLLQCLNFLERINKPKIRLKFKKFQYASDNCKSINEHMLCVEKRIFNLLKNRSKNRLIVEAKKFVKDNILNQYIFLKKKVFSNLKLLEIKKELKKKEFIVSPSDFGFHNIIKKDKMLYFIDFEYAGFDDPVKLLCDFICNPDYKINKNNEKYFIKNFLKIFSTNLIKRRFELLLKFHRLKWCTMLLNDLLSGTYRKRRSFVKNYDKDIDYNKKLLLAKKYYFKFFKN